MFAGIHIQALSGETLPPNVYLVNLDGDPRRVLPHEFISLQTTARYVIPRHGLSKISAQFNYKVGSADSKLLLNTMNYGGSDSQKDPPNVAKQVLKQQVKKTLFTKQVVEEWETVRVNSDLKDSLSNNSELFTCRGVRSLVPFWQDCRVVAFHMEVNERLFHYTNLIQLDIGLSRDSQTLMVRKMSL